PATVAVLASLLTWAVGRFSPGLVVLGYALPYFVAAAVLGEFWRATRGRSRATGVHPGRALLALLSQNHRRYGGLIVHLGVVLVAIGVAASAVGKVEREATLERDPALVVGRYQLTLTGVSGAE